MRPFLKFTATIVLLAISIPALWWVARRWTEGPRNEWKVHALERLNTLSLTNNSIRAEISRPDDPESGWANEHVLLMTNGEYIVYEYRHGRNDIFPPHLFLGHGSDRQWLYSSYHFCNHMQMIRYDDPPASIAEFCRRYFVRPFDGKSDDCLKLTR